MINPAFILFEDMFNKAAKDPGPTMPQYFVPMNVFLSACKAKGLDVPQDVIGFWKWSQEKGFRRFVERVISKYYRKHGMTRSPADLASLRLQRKFEKQQRSLTQ